MTDRVFRSTSKLLEINSKSGLYPLYVAYSIYRRKCGEIPEADIAPAAREKKWRETVKDNVFVICKTPMAASITRRTLVGYSTAAVNTVYVENLIDTLKDTPEKFIKAIGKGKFWKKEDKEMKFDAVVGNPPYQLKGMNDGNRDNPIYHYFMDAAFSLSSRVSLITPGRFLFDAGQTPKVWNRKMLDDPHLKVVRYWQKSDLVFPNVEIKGGVAVTYRDGSKDFGKIGVFTIHPKLNAILRKVLAMEKDRAMFDSLVSSQGIFRFSAKFLLENKKIAVELANKGTGTKIVSKEFETMPQVFIQKRLGDSKYIELIGRVNGERVSRFIRKDWLEKCEYLDCFKVFIPEANGTGAFGEELSEPMIGQPLIGSTDTFISIGRFPSATEAENCLKYIKTRFARAMLGVLKATQHNTKSTWRYVPMQNFSEPWDDAKLYKKYKLTREEIAFIESMIKPMA